LLLFSFELRKIVLLLSLLSMTFMAWHVTMPRTQVCAKGSLWVSHTAINSQTIFVSAT
jgi:hypothetical protein